VALTFENFTGGEREREREEEEEEEEEWRRKVY
jgi:hypothetical protein